MFNFMHFITSMESKTCDAGKRGAQTTGKKGEGCGYPQSAGGLNFTRGVEVWLTAEQCGLLFCTKTSNKLFKKQSL